MTRISKHLLAASALLGAAMLAVPALAQRGGDMMGRPHMNGSGMMGGRMGRGEMAQMCGQMMQGMPGREHGGRPNQQWRRPAPTPDRD